MTSEVVLMNRQAVALAADSATTVSYWADGERKTRYFKGANKIFNLSKHQPIGLMTYDSANVQGVPWEILIKSFRDEIADNSYPTVKEYAENLFLYIERNSTLFSHDYQVKQFMAETVNAGLYIFVSVVHDKKYESARTAATKRKASDSALRKIERDIKRAGQIGNLTKEEVDEAVNKYLDSAQEEFSEYKAIKEHQNTIDISKIAELSIRSVFSPAVPNSEKTGIVVVGYGEGDYFPVMLEYSCYGIILGKFVYEEKGEEIIDPENTSVVSPFAQGDMIRTFIFGVSPDAIRNIDSLFGKALQGFCKELEEAGHLAPDKKLTDIIASTRESYSSDLLGRQLKSHSWPLRNAVGMLPIDELAELAETLVSLESLKERVTRESESVSGPVDVAVISKSDGFIWIKRKHYFNSELNPRFFSRLGS